jgi:hypothetical protein
MIAEERLLERFSDTLVGVGGTGERVGGAMTELQQVLLLVPGLDSDLWHQGGEWVRHKERLQPVRLRTRRVERDDAPAVNLVHHIVGRIAPLHRGEGRWEDERPNHGAQRLFQYQSSGGAVRPSVQHRVQVTHRRLPRNRRSPPHE